MSDIQRPALAKAPILIARKCHCGDWAGFGFGKGEQQQSWCWTHYPYKTSARLEAAEMAAVVRQEVA